MSKYAGVMFIHNCYNKAWMTKEYIENKLKERKDDGVYYYRIPDKLKLKKGDFVLVEALDKMNVVKVVELCNDIKCHYNGPIKTLFSKLDLSYYQNTVEKEKRIKQLELQLEDMYKKVSKLQVLRTVAKDNKEMQELLDEYEKLGD